MKRKILSLILAALTIALLCGCTSEQDADKGTSAPETTAAQQADTSAADVDTTVNDTETDDSMTVTFRDGTAIPLGAVADDVIPNLGEPMDRLEAPSCVHPGNDVVYTYNGYTVTTQPDADGKNIVASVEVTSDAVALENGVTVNSTVADAKAAFGEEFTEAFGQITYERGDFRIDITGDGETVTALSFTYVGDR